MKKEITFWIGASAVSTIIVAAHPDVNFKQMALVAVLAIVLWLCGYVFERHFALDEWSESPVPKQQKWIASFIFYGLGICLSLYLDFGYWYTIIGAVIILAGFPDDEKFPTRQEWFEIFKVALAFLIIASLVVFLFQFINFFPA